MKISAALEALFYIVDEPIAREKIYELFPEHDGEEIEEALNVIEKKFAEESGLILREIGGGLILSTRPEYDEFIREFLKIQKKSQLSKQALMTLAIVAYEQPITTPEIKEIRGSDPSGVIKTLLQRKLIRIAGRKDVLGRPFMYATTKEFLVYFGLGSLDDLPKPDEFANLIDLDNDDHRDEMTYKVSEDPRFREVIEEQEDGEELDEVTDYETE